MAVRQLLGAEKLGAGKALGHQRGHQRGLSEAVGWKVRAWVFGFFWGF